VLMNIFSACGINCRGKGRSSYAPNHSNGAREGRVGNDIHARVWAQPRVKELRTKLRGCIRVVPRPGAVVLAPDYAAVGGEADRAGDQDGVQPPVVHRVLQVAVGRLLNLQQIDS